MTPPSVTQQGDQAVDPYTFRTGETREAPTSLRGRLRYLGPGIVVSGSIVGSGEILLTAGLGANVGFVMLWWGTPYYLASGDQNHLFFPI